ncbi:MAG: APC family permease, partial [Solirubrobacteraceae bacterium]|nr:APC family permease [Solirubrobacteraceae bacterium]
DGGSGYTFGGFLVAVSLVGWAFIGFETAGAVAEEVENPRVNVPKALIFSLVFVASIVMYAGLALVLAIPDLGAIAAGNVVDPIAMTLESAFGSWIVTPMFIVVCTGFTAGLVAVQAAVSRVVFALSRDKVLPASATLGKLSGREHLPINAIFVTSGIAAVLLVVAVSLKFYDTLIGLATVGFYVSFFLPLVALLILRVREGFDPSPTGGEVGIKLGKYGTTINALAVAWLAFEIVNIAWPRELGLSWYVEWGCLISMAVIAVVGAVVYGAVKAQGHILPDAEANADDLAPSLPALEAV